MTKTVEHVFTSISVPVGSTPINFDVYYFYYTSLIFISFFRRYFMPPLLWVNAISKRYSSLLALDNISFSLDRGEIIGLVGRRGAGKTSLLHAIAGISPPSQGEILFEGEPVDLLNTRRTREIGIEIVHQVPQLVDKQNITVNIFLGHEICWPPRIGLPDWDSMHLRSNELLSEFDLPPKMITQRISSLNDEQRQIIAIARALCVPPRLLMLDESLSSLSFQRQQILLEHIKQLADRGSGIIISSDNLKHLFSITNRILVLYEGRLAADRYTADCTPRDIVELIVGTSSREQVTPVVWALESYHAAQRQTEELYRAQDSLHQSLQASDSLNRQLVMRLSEQVSALDRLNAALQQAHRRLMTESEEERKALARELHDQVIQDLLSFNYRLEDTESSELSAEQRSELVAIRNGIRSVVSDLRQMCRDLRPPTIDNHGLPSAIRSLAQEWAERNSIQLDLDIDPALGRLPESIELSVYRIVQEGLNNVRKHAAARFVHLSLQRTPMDSLLVRLADDGSGIPEFPNLASLSASKHFGLLGISERAALLGGTMQVTSPPNGGLILQVEIPSPYPSI